jgi:two-component system chemotaxis response regulator CheY
LARRALKCREQGNRAVTAVPFWNEAERNLSSIPASLLVETEMLVKSASNGGTLKRLKVLIVDDSVAMRKIIVRTLEQTGLAVSEIVTAGNGLEALLEVEKGGVDLVLSDIDMPVMDGLEFLKRIANLEVAKSVPVVMITTVGSQARVVEALHDGAKGYIRKPFTAEQVREKLSPLLPDAWPTS